MSKHYTDLNIKGNLILSNIQSGTSVNNIGIDTNGVIISVNQSIEGGDSLFETGTTINSTQTKRTNRNA